MPSPSGYCLLPCRPSGSFRPLWFFSSPPGYIWNYTSALLSFLCIYECSRAPGEPRASLLQSCKAQWGRRLAMSISHRGKKYSTPLVWITSSSLSLCPGAECLWVWLHSAGWGPDVSTALCCHRGALWPQQPSTAQKILFISRVISAALFLHSLEAMISGSGHMGIYHPLHAASSSSSPALCNYQSVTAHLDRSALRWTCIVLEGLESQDNFRGKLETSTCNFLILPHPLPCSDGKVEREGTHAMAEIHQTQKLH